MAPVIIIFIIISTWKFPCSLQYMQLLKAFWGRQVALVATKTKSRSTPLWHPDSRAKTTGSHMVLRARNSGAESGSELFKGSKDVASLLVCTRKKIFWLGGVDFLWVTS